MINTAVSLQSFPLRCIIAPSLPRNWFLLSISAISSGGRVVLCGVGAAAGGREGGREGERRIVLERCQREMRE